MNHTTLRQRQRVTQRIKHIPDNISSSIDSGDTFCPEFDTTEDISTDVTNLVPVLHSRENSLGIFKPVLS